MVVADLERVSRPGPGNIHPGQIKEIVLAQDTSAGKLLGQLKKAEVTLTLDAGEKDLDVLSKYGRARL